MTTTILVVGGLVLVAILLGILAGRHLFGRANSPIVSDVSSELVRLQERERGLQDQITKLEGQLLALTTSSEIQGADLAGEKEKTARSDEKITGLERALVREKEVAGETQQRLSAELAEATQLKDRLSAASSEQLQKLAAADQLETELRGQLKRAGDHISERDRTIVARDLSLEALRSHLATRDSDLAASAEREAGLVRTIAERDEQLKGLQDNLKSEFENIANKILAVTSDKLTEKSNETIATILEPLKARIVEFQQKVETTHLEDNRQRSVLGEQIKQIAQAGHTLGTQAENLTKALKGDSQLRGQWAEIRLERILEKSGLVRGREFVVQGEGLNLKSEDGGSQRPDIVILLPQKRHFVIDSKLSLNDYVDYEAATSDDERAVLLKRIILSVRGHIDDLSSKKYQLADAINSHELVFMFIPIEGVASLVLQSDGGLYEYAWGRRIVMVSPSTLFMTMQTVSSIWRYERQSENAQAIADQAGLLYDKLVGVIEDLNDVSRSIHAAADAHGEAMKKLSSGRGNALQKAQKLRALGVGSKKELPPILIGGEKHIIEENEDGESALALIDQTQ